MLTYSAYNYYKTKISTKKLFFNILLTKNPIYSTISCEERRKNAQDGGKCYVDEVWKAIKKNQNR